MTKYLVIKGLRGDANRTLMGSFDKRQDAEDCAKTLDPPWYIHEDMTERQPRLPKSLREAIAGILYETILDASSSTSEIVDRILEEIPRWAK